MIYNVAQLLKDPIGATRVYDLHETADLLTDIPARAPYVGHLKLTHLNEGILAEARIVTVVEVACRRCLRPVQLPLELEFVEEYRPSIDINSGAPVLKREGEEYFTLDERHTLDLTEAVRQYAWTNLPQFALCREDCAGLCAMCGRDLNEGPCDCQQESTDPRLAVLGCLLGESERSQ
ncbi:MAG: DUF177 domain-containing protein [Chloroflexi bacterium]|nr:DUF177 domain-containing protein [Chloroflexota bacterium]MCL5108117.1 DUF177 domain-containing protein [Chloroflexota bacterium]